MSLQREILEQTFTEDLYAIPGKVLVLLPHSWVALRPDEVKLLTKILGSVKLKIAQVQILSRETVDLTELVVFNPSSILSFGSKIKQIKTSYQVTDWNGAKAIEADALGSFDDAKKKQLWAALQELLKSS